MRNQPVRRGARPAPRRQPSAALLEAVERSGIRRNVLARLAGWPCGNELSWALTRPDGVVATPLACARMTALALMLAVPADEVWADDREVLR